MTAIEHWNAYPHPRADDGVGHKAALITGRRLNAMTELVRKSDYDALADLLAGAVEALRRYGDHDRSCGVRLGVACSCGFAAAVESEDHLRDLLTVRSNTNIEETG